MRISICCFLSGSSRYIPQCEPDKFQMRSDLFVCVAFIAQRFVRGCAANFAL